MVLLPLAFTVALLATTWTYISPIIGVPTWPVFIVWAIFFIAGGNAGAISKGAAPLISGVVLAWLAVQAGATQAGTSLEPVGIPIAIGVIAFVMVMMSNIGLFSLIPAQFVGAAIFFGTGLDLKGTFASIPIGFALGYASATIPRLITYKKKKQSQATTI